MGTHAYVREVTPWRDSYTRCGDAQLLSTIRLSLRDLMYESRHMRPASRMPTKKSRQMVRYFGIVLGRRSVEYAQSTHSDHHKVDSEGGPRVTTQEVDPEVLTCEILCLSVGESVAFLWWFDHPEALSRVASRGNGHRVG